MTSKLMTDEVYGITRNIPLNYVVRRNVDDRLDENLSRDKHIVIFGSSKQGKTCLRKHCLDPEKYIIVQCSNRWSLYDLNSAILKGAGYQITQSVRKSHTGKNKIIGTVGGNLFPISGKVSGEEEKEETTETLEKNIEIDVEDVNDIISALKTINFNKYIVLEDFHYLPTETQIDFAIALKAFHEASEFTFVIIGVWLEENRLIVYNGDLISRVISVNADNWTEEELREVIDEGAKLLNINFADQFKTSLLNECYESVYIVQEVCREACQSNDIRETQDDFKMIGQNVDVKSLIKDIVSMQNARYMSFIAHFSEGFQKTELEMYKWLLYPVLISDLEELDKGLSYSHIRNVIQNKHPLHDKLNPGNLTIALQSVSSLQVKKDIKPFILDYDQTHKKLNVVDKGFFIWLANQEIDELLEAANIELDEQ